jgi:hypothetical protein
MSELLPEWPLLQVGVDAAGVLREAIIGSRVVIGSELHVRYEYERARAEAAMARLRVAVEALRRIPREGLRRTASGVCEEALRQIGEIPHE